MVTDGHALILPIICWFKKRWATYAIYKAPFKFVAVEGNNKCTIEFSSLRTTVTVKSLKPLYSFLYADVDKSVWV